MLADKYEQWPSGIGRCDFSVYRPRRMGFLGHWLDDDWAVKAYGIQSRELDKSEPVVGNDLV